MAASNRQDCRTCRQAYQIGPWDSEAAKKLKSAGPPCKTCFPGVHPINKPVFEVYQRCSNQWINADGGRLVGIRAEAIEAAMRVCRVPVRERLAVFDAVSGIGAEVAAGHNEKIKAKNAKVR